VDYADLTGAHVISNYPVSVISGNYHTQVTYNGADTGAQHLCEMMPPVQSMGNTYYTFKSVSGADSKATYKPT
jgi:hypothetical protein